MNKRRIIGYTIVMLLLPVTLVGALCQIIHTAYQKGYYLMDDITTEIDKYIQRGEK